MNPENASQYAEAVRQPGTAPKTTEPAIGAVPASGPSPDRRRALARSIWGKVLAGVAVVCLLLAGLMALGPGRHMPAWALLPILYVGYFLWARGVLKVETQVLTGAKASLENAKDDDQHTYQDAGRDNS